MIENNLVIQRRNWLSNTHLEERKKFNETLISSHGLLLQVDIEKAFCAGAWLSVIVLSQSAIEATIRQIEKHDYENNAQILFGDMPELQKIRSIRNEILHPMKPGSPSILWSVPNGDVAACHAVQEELAKTAVRLVYRSVYAQVRK